VRASQTLRIDQRGRDIMSYEDSNAAALASTYDDIWLVAAARTPFEDYNGVLRDVSPTDLGVCAARALFERSGIAATAIQSVVAGNMAQIDVQPLCHHASSIHDDDR
jgi:hypothetical protein